MYTRAAVTLADLARRPGVPPRGRRLDRDHARRRPRRRRSRRRHVSRQSEVRVEAGRDTRASAVIVDDSVTVRAVRDSAHAAAVSGVCRRGRAADAGRAAGARHQPARRDRSDGRARPRRRRSAPFVVVGPRARIGARTVVHPHVVDRRRRDDWRGLRDPRARVDSRRRGDRRPRGRAGRRRDRQRRLRLRPAAGRHAPEDSAGRPRRDRGRRRDRRALGGRSAGGRRDAHRRRARRSTTSCRSRTASGSAATCCWPPRSASPAARCSTTT